MYSCLFDRCVIVIYSVETSYGTYARVMKMLNCTCEKFCSRNILDVSFLVDIMTE